MTGIYVRFQRDGKWMSVEIDQLPDDEMKAWVAEHITDLPRARDWIVGLAKWIRDNVTEGDASA